MISTLVRKAHHSATTVGGKVWAWWMTAVIIFGVVDGLGLAHQVTTHWAQITAHVHTTVAYLYTYPALVGMAAAALTLVALIPAHRVIRNSDRAQRVACTVAWAGAYGSWAITAAVSAVWAVQALTR